MAAEITPELGPGSKLSTRLVRMNPHERWTKESLDGIVGQVPAFKGVQGVTKALVLRTWIDGDWVCAQMELLA